MAKKKTIEEKDKLDHSDEQCILNRFVLLGPKPKDGPAEPKNHLQLSGTAAKAIVKLSRAEELSEFINIEPHLLSALVPRVRFFRASYDPVENTSLNKEVEFIFNDHFSKQDVERITTSRSGRGFGVGLKSFSFDYTGTTPATSDSIIECSLKLHFNSLDDLFAVGQNGIAFKDLITPSSREVGQDQDQPGPTQYNPDYFRIKVVVGYADPVGNIWERQPKALIEQIKKMKRIFYLTIVKHDLDFKDNGTMSLGIDYHAYTEKALQQDDADVFRALLTKEDRERLDAERNNYEKAKKKPSDGEKCKDEDEEEKRKKKIESSEETLLTIKGKAYSALMSRLFANRRIFTVHVTDKKSIDDLEANKKDVRIFRHGFGSDGRKEQKSIFDDVQTAINNKDKNNWVFDNRGDDIDDLNEDFTARDNSWFNPNGLSSDEFRFDFFYLGELLDVAFEMINGEGNRFKNSKFVLGDVPYLDAETNTLKYINMYEIPVSMNVYGAWFMETVVRTGQRDTYPINDFVRDLFNNLVQPILAPKSCAADEKNRCGDIGAIRPTFSSEIFEIPLTASSLCPLTFDAMSKKSGKLSVESLRQLPEPLPLSENATYIYYYARSKAEAVFSPQAGDSREEGDNKRGIYHFRAARDRGLVKSIKFKKQDQKYLKEARMVKDGGTSTGILRERYNANIVMNGLPTLRPGMLAYIPPDSFGIGSSSMANELGIGGYYSIIKVLNRIDSKFETEIECSWQSNGTGKQDEACCAPKEDPCDQKVEKPKKPTKKQEQKQRVSHNAAVADVKMGML
tara:strand:- start:1076 stop:3457 length:2382 start_codon:yes stop_codon:yes gene_type:complete